MGRGPNVELLDRTLAEVEKAARRKRLRWDQRTYREVEECGTAMCFAGWAISLDGGVWADQLYPALRGLASWEVIPRPGERATNTLFGRRVVRAYDSARRRLGLTDNEAIALFSAENTLPDLRRIVAEIKQRAAR